MMLTPDDVSPLSSEWRTYFGVLAGVCSGLTGLSFVAVTVHSAILAERASRLEARRTFVSFLSVLVVALLLARPQSEGAIAGDIALTCAVALVLTIVDFERGVRLRTAIRGMLRTPHVLIRLAVYLVG